MNIFDQILSELALPPQSRRVYLFLVEHGAANARTIGERLAIPRTSVYDHIAPLLESGIVIELDKEGKKFFSLGSIDDLINLVNERKQHIDTLAKALIEKRESLISSAETFDPKIRFFDGKERLVQMLSDMLWDGVSEIESVWPYHEMIRVFGEETLNEINKKRIRHKIALRTVWTSTPKVKAHIWKGGDWKVERRYAPRSFAPAMGHTIYGDKVLFISSHDELYGFIVHSKDFAKMKRTEFELLWKSSLKK